MPEHKMIIFLAFNRLAENIHKELIENSQLVDGFAQLCEGFSFVYLWDHPEITSETFQIYAINVPAKEAPCNFIYSVKRLHYNTLAVETQDRKSVVFQLLRCSS